MAHSKVPTKRVLITLIEMLLGAIAGTFLSALVLQWNPDLLLAVYVTVVLILVTYFTFKELGKIYKLLEKKRVTKIISENEMTLVKHFVEIIKASKKYIMCTGGISRQSKYLKAIEEKVKSGGIEYWRVFAGPEITEEMYDHLHKTLTNENTHVSLLQHGAIHAYVMVTENVAVITLPDPVAFRTFLITQEQSIVDRIKMYVQQLYGKARELNIDTLEELIRSREIKVKPKKTAMFTSS